MNLLCLDTSTEACTAALCLGKDTREYFEIAPRRHGELLLPAITRLLDEAGLTLNRLDAIAYGCGPGAFTGVRIAVAVAQGLALAVDLPMAPISTLATLAQYAVEEVGHDTAILSAIDARMGEVYAGAFGHHGADEAVHSLGDETVTPPAQLDLPAHDGPWFGTGSGWQAYGAELERRVPAPLYGRAPEALPHAAAMRLLAERAWAQQAICSPESPVVTYLRDRVV